MDSPSFRLSRNRTDYRSRLERSHQTSAKPELPANVNEAVGWYRQAADQGDAASAARLGKMVSIATGENQYEQRKTALLEALGSEADEEKESE